MPKVSVIIPTYNRADMIGDALDSLIQQTSEDWEAIVVDDGSTDDTEAVVSRFADGRIRYLYQANKGLPGARNTGIRNATGEYIAFLDSDDLFLPDKLKVQSQALDQSPDVGLVASGYVEVDAHLNRLREVQSWHGHPHLGLTDWLQNNPFIVNAVLVRKTWLEKAGLFDEAMRYVEDWDVWLRLAQCGCRMMWVEAIVCVYRLHDTNMMRQAELMKKGMLRMFDKFFAQPNLPVDALKLRNRAYASVYVDSATRAFAAGLGMEGKDCLTQAIRLEPEWGQGKPPRVLNSLASFALSPSCSNANEYMNLVANHLPESLKANWSPRKGRALLFAVSAFDSARDQSQSVSSRGGPPRGGPPRGGVPNTLGRRRVLTSVLSAIRNDPTWVTNRGLLAIARRALLSKPTKTSSRSIEGDK